jgi:hypothetical protein
VRVGEDSLVANQHTDMWIDIKSRLRGRDASKRNHLRK